MEQKHQVGDLILFPISMPIYCAVCALSHHMCLFSVASTVFVYAKVCIECAVGCGQKEARVRFLPAGPISTPSHPAIVWWPEQPLLEHRPCLPESSSTSEINRLRSPCRAPCTRGAATMTCAFPRHCPPPPPCPPPTITFPGTSQLAMRCDAIRFDARTATLNRRTCFWTKTTTSRSRTLGCRI